jgi:hypothetical protein
MPLDNLDRVLTFGSFCAIVKKNLSDKRSYFKSSCYYQCCRSGTIYSGYGPGSDCGKVPYSVPDPHPATDPAQLKKKIVQNFAFLTLETTLLPRKS